MTPSNIRPSVSISDAEQIALEFYGLTASARELDSYCDRNFLLEDRNAARTVLKIANGAEEKANLDLQNSMMNHLESGDNQATFPKVISSVNDQDIEVISLRDGQPHLVRLLTYLPGKPMALVSNHTPALLRSLGGMLGTMDQVLTGFDHARPIVTLAWDLKHIERMLTGSLEHITRSVDRTLVEHFLRLYRSMSIGKFESLRHSFIHGDANNYNVLVSPADSAAGEADQWRVSGLIDFGDLVYSQTINNLAICLAYVMLDKADPIEAAVHTAEGYVSHFHLEPDELEQLLVLACMRICLSATMAAVSRQADPENEYLSVTEQPAWSALRILENISIASATERMILACNQ